MASMDDDSPSDRKRKKPTRKGPCDIIKKMAVVLTEGVVGKNKKTNEVFMPITIVMSNAINSDPRLRQEIVFTKSMTPEDIKEVIKKALPILANAERFFCAKAVQKVKLDFCGERRIWSGEVLNREIRGHSVLYIYWEEENNDQQPSLTAQVEYMQISRNEENNDQQPSLTAQVKNMQISRNGHSSDTCDSGIEFSEGPLPVNNRQDDDVQRYYSMEEEANEIFNRYPLFENSPLDSPSGVTPAFHVAGSEVNNTAATQEHTLSHLRVEGEDAINSNAENLKSDSRVESTEAVNSEEEVNFPLRVEREDANSNAVPKSCDSRLESAEAVNRREEVNFPSRVEREDANSSAVPKSCDSRVESAEAVNSGEEVNFPSRVEREDANSNAVPKSCDSRVESAEAINSEEKINLVKMIVPSSSPLKGGDQFLLVLKDVLPEIVRGGYANFGQHRVELKKENNVNLTGIIPAAQKPGPVKVQVYSQSERLLGEIDFQYIDLTDRVAYEAVQHGIEGVTKLFSLMGKHSVNMWNQSASVKQNTVLPGQATDAPNDGSEVRLKDGNEDLMQVFEDRIKCLLEENCGHCPTNTEKWIQLSRVVCEIYEKFACSENFKGNQQTCPQEREEPYFADAENSSCMSSEDENASLSDPDNCSETPNGCSHQALCSEEITSYTLMASQDDTPVLCLDVSVLNVENEESKDKDDELFETLITENNSPKHSDSSISVTSNQQSPTHPGSITQEAPQSPLSNTWWNDIGDSKLSVAPAQGSDEKIHSGQEWEESAIIEGESLASWFDLCENEDAGKDKHSRWEISPIEPNKTDGGVEKDVSDSEEGLSQEQELFYEQGNSHIHLSLPDDTSVQSRRPEVENKENQDIPLLEAARFSHTAIVRLLTENGAAVNKHRLYTLLLKVAIKSHTDIVRFYMENGADVNERRLDDLLLEAVTNDHTAIVGLFIENGAAVNKRRLDTLLLEAARNGHTAIVRLLIENGADVNTRRSLHGPTPLTAAARNYHGDVVRLLIENGDDVTEEELADLLLEAATNGHTAIVRLLIENGADVNERRLDELLLEAARNGHTAIVRLLIENGADVNTLRWLFGSNPLIEAARRSHTDVVQLLIENGAVVTEEELDELLLEAARNGHTAIVRLLIENGADVNTRRSLFGSNPLIEAARRSHTDVVQLLIENGAVVTEEELADLLLEAATNGHTAIVWLLIENGADVNERRLDTLLLEAVINGHTDFVRFLIENGADVNKGRGNTPLTKAVWNGHTDIVRLLIENGADVKKRGGNCELTPLTIAVKKGHTNIVRVYIENEAINKGEMETALTNAARNGHTDIVKLLIENGAGVNKGGWDAPLTKAASNGHTDIVKLLIENGADVNKGKRGTPLTKAASNGHTDIVELLIENGADVNKGKRGTPLTKAASNGHTDIVELLIENGADINKGKRNTPLTKAASNGYTNIVKLLIESGADANKGGWDNLLTAAVWNGHTDIVRLLVENGADVNKRGGKSMSTPLTIAVRERHTDIVRLLIENGADVNNRGGKCELTPITIAVCKGYTDIVKLLIENGANVKNRGGKSKLTPLTIAICRGHIGIVRLLIENGADVNIRGGDTKLSLERELDVQLRGKKTASLPKRPGKKLKTQTEMTSPRDIVEEGKCGKDSMTDVELGLNCLHLSPRCEQFKPFIMEESPGDSSIMHHDFKPINKRMDRVTLTDVGNAKQGHCVVVEIAKTHTSGNTTIIYGRRINEEGSGVGEAIQLSTQDLKDTWKDEEMIAENVQIGSVVKYVQVGDEFLFHGNTKRPRWDMARIFLSCTDGAHRGIGNAFPNSKLLTEESYQDYTPKETSCFISLKCGVVENDRISVITKLGELFNLKLNCREDVILPLSPSTLELSHVEDNKDVVEMEEPLLISGVDGLSKPPYPVLGESLNLRDEPKETSVKGEKPEADPEEKDDEDGNAF